MEAQAAGLQAFAERALGVSTWVDLACLPARSTEDPGEYHLGRVIDRRVGRRGLGPLRAAGRIRPEYLAADDAGRGAGAARRRHAGVSIHHDSVDPTHPLLVDCFAGQILRALEERGVAPQQRRTRPRRRRAGRARHPCRLLPPDAVALGASRSGPGRGRLRPPPAAVPPGDPGTLPGRAARLAPAAAVPVGRRAVRLRPGHARRSPAGSPRGGGLAAARPAAGSPGDPGLARTADAPALAREAGPSRRRGFPPPGTRPRRPGRGCGPARIGCRRAKRRSGRGPDVSRGPGIPTRSPRSSRGSSHRPSATW